jgi:Basic region leucine zipper
MNTTISLDDLFNDIYYMDLLPTLAETGEEGQGETFQAEPASSSCDALPAITTSSVTQPAITTTTTTTIAPAEDAKIRALLSKTANATKKSSPLKRTADQAELTLASDNGNKNEGYAGKEAAAFNNNDDEDGGPVELTEEQIIERRERNREHAKRSRLRKKFLLESLQEQIHGLEEQLDRFKEALRTEIPDKAETIITSVCGEKDKFTPMPMPSGFGPVKTLMEPDFRLSTCMRNLYILV